MFDFSCTHCVMWRVLISLLISNCGINSKPGAWKRSSSSSSTQWLQLFELVQNGINVLQLHMHKHIAEFRAECWFISISHITSVGFTLICCFRFFKRSTTTTTKLSFSFFLRLDSIEGPELGANGIFKMRKKINLKRLTNLHCDSVALGGDHIASNAITHTSIRVRAVCEWNQLNEMKWTER